jgi:hypothetical protein
MKLLRTLSALVVACTCASALAQWQWIDKDGRKVYSDRAPSPDVLEKNIVRRPAGRVPSAPAPASDPVNGEQATNAPGPVVAASSAKGAGTDKELEAKKKQAAEAELAKRKDEEARVTKTKVENCARAKQAKTTLDSGVRVSRSNAAGEREIMDDAARATELKRIQTVIDNDCK